MKQYCRYCNWCTAESICTEKNIDVNPTSINHCKDFSFNEIDATMSENSNGEIHKYTPQIAKKKQCDGQVSLFDFIPERSNLVRTECLFIPGGPCNILNAHDVARMIDIDCKYGCCKGCNDMQSCGAACNNRFVHIIKK